MRTFHAVVWMDHQEAHVVMFDREHVQAQRVPARSHHKHQGKAGDMAAFYAEVAQALTGAHEVLVTGPGSARNEFRNWCTSHQKGIAAAVVDSIASDHPSDAQLVAMAKKYFKKYDAMAADPTQV
jgi:stalled ribosome rescue protein Dom34